MMAIADWMIDIVDIDSNYEAYLYNTKIAFKMFIVLAEKEQVSYFTFIKIVTANIEKDKKDYVTLFGKVLEISDGKAE